MILNYSLTYIYRIIHEPYITNYRINSIVKELHIAITTNPQTFDKYIYIYIYKLNSIVSFS